MNAEAKTSVSDRLAMRLSRRTTSGRRFIPQIDGMRFVAIALVVIVHVTSSIYLLGLARGVVFTHTPQQDLFWRLTQRGVWGVELFFVISGFILALPFASAHLRKERPVPIGKYFLRRVTRLEPPYIIALSINLLAVVWLTGAGLPSLVPHYLAGLFYLHGSVYGSVNPVQIVTWSLEVEVQFYMLVPLLARVFTIGDPRLRRGVMTAAAVAAIVLQQAFISDATRLAYSILNFIQYFLVGFLLADVYLVEWRDRQPDHRRLWDAAVPLVAVVWLLVGHGLGPTVMAPYAYPVLAFVLFVAAFKGTLFSAFLSNRWIFTIGGMCYSIYLTHSVAIEVARRLSLSAVVSSNLAVDLLIQLLVVTPFVLIVGAVFFVLVERPFMNPRWPQDLAARLGRR